MRRRRIILWTVVGIGAALVIGAGFTFRETRIDYFDDDAFLTRVGRQRITCLRFDIMGGRTGSWRIVDQYSCLTRRRVLHKCQQTNGAGGYIDIACPPNAPFTVAP